MVQPLKFRNGLIISPTLYQACDYLSMLGLKLNHVNKVKGAPASRCVDSSLINITHAFNIARLQNESIQIRIFMSLF